MPKTGDMRLYRDAFQPREVHVRNSRDALHTLGVGIADDAPLQTLFAMSRQLTPPTVSHGGRGQRTDCEALPATYASAKAAGSRIARNGCATRLALSITRRRRPMSQPNHIGECIAADKKPRRGILDPATQDGRRVAGPSEEVDAHYQTIYDDELEEGDFADDSGDSQADCDAIAAAGLRAISSDCFPKFDDIPNSLSRPDLNGLADSFRIWAKMPILVDADTSIFGPTQRTVYDRVCEWAADLLKSVHQRDAPPTAPHAARDGGDGGNAGPKIDC